MGTPLRKAAFYVRFDKSGSRLRRVGAVPGGSGLRTGVALINWDPRLIFPIGAAAQRRSGLFSDHRDVVVGRPFWFLANEEQRVRGSAVVTCLTPEEVLGDQHERKRPRR
jgi:hypothetical protein